MRAVAAWATLLLLSCGSNEGGPGPSDGDLGGEDAGLSDTGPLDLGFVDGAVPNPVEVGTGVDGFVPLADGALIELSQGPQGGGRLMGFHIWGAVKVRGFAAQGALVRFRYLSLPDRAAIGIQERMVTLQPDGDALIAYGFATRLNDCCEILDRRIVMRVEVEDRNGMMGADEREVTTPGACIDNTTQQDVCP
jgi:hypothetical protein